MHNRKNEPVQIIFALNIINWMENKYKHLYVTAALGGYRLCMIKS